MRFIYNLLLKESDGPGREWSDGILVNMDRYCANVYSLLFMSPLDQSEAKFKMVWTRGHCERGDNKVTYTRLQ